MENFRFRTHNKNMLNANGKFSKGKSCVGWKRAALCIIIVIFSVYMIGECHWQTPVLYQSNRWPDVVIQSMLIHNKNDGKTSIKTMNTCSMVLFMFRRILQPLCHVFFLFLPFFHLALCKVSCYPCGTLREYLNILIIHLYSALKFCPLKLIQF